MNQFATAQQTSAAKLQTFYQRFKTKGRTLRVNEAKITGKNVFNEDHFRSESNDK